MTSRERIEDLTLRFTDAFNRGDLDAVMSFFAEDAVYEEYQGRRSRGLAAIREAFVPQFRGDFGAIRFDAEDLFVDERDEKAMIRWRCTLERADGRRRSWRGLDLLRFAGGRVTEKLTYAKAEVPRFE